MAVINTGLNVAGLKSEFFAQFDATATHFQELATRIDSNKDKETYKFLGQTPQLREWGTGRLAKGLLVESYDVENLKYEATLEVDRDEISDDQTGQIRIRTREMAEHAATHKDWLIAQLLVNGGAAGFNAYDGKTFFANDHESGASGAQDNTLSHTVADTANVTTDEMKAAIRQAMQRMIGLKNDVGESMRITPSGLVVVAPAGLYFTTLEALNATLINSTSNVLAGAASAIHLPDLSSGSKFYLLKTDGVVRPFIFQDREPVEFNAIAEGSEEEFMREKHYYGVRARYRLTYGYWQYAIEVTLTT